MASSSDESQQGLMGQASKFVSSIFGGPGSTKKKEGPIKSVQMAAAAKVAAAKKVRPLSAPPLLSISDRFERHRKRRLVRSLARRRWRQDGRRLSSARLRKSASGLRQRNVRLVKLRRRLSVVAESVRRRLRSVKRRLRSAPRLRLRRRYVPQVDLSGYFAD